MHTIEHLSQIIEGFYAKSRLEKTLSILSELRSGYYQSLSKERQFLIGNYKALILSLSPEDYLIIKQKLIDSIPHLIEERTQRKIAYSLLSDIIHFSCLQDDIDVYQAYEQEILRLVKQNKERYLHHLINLAQTKQKLARDISNIEDLFVEKYLKPSRMRTINYNNIIIFASQIPNVNRRKILLGLIKQKPFYNDDRVIELFVAKFDELKKIAVLI